MDTFSKDFNKARKNSQKKELNEFSKTFNALTRDPEYTPAPNPAAPLERVRNVQAFSNYVRDYGNARIAENNRRYRDPLTEMAREDAAKAIAVRDYIRYSDPLTMMAREEAEKATRKNDPLMDLALEMQTGKGNAASTVGNDRRYQSEVASLDPNTATPGDYMAAIARDQQRAYADMVTPGNTALDRQRRETNQAFRTANAFLPLENGSPDAWDTYNKLYDEAVKEDEELKALGGTAARELPVTIPKSFAAGTLGAVRGLVNEAGYLAQTIAKGQVAAGADKLRGLGYDEQAKAYEDDLKRMNENGLQSWANFGTNYINEANEKAAGYGKVGQTISNVAQGVGGMVPSILSNLVVPGSGLPVMFIQASGNATEEAKAAGASDGAALLYGTAVGGVEVLTEKMFGGIPGLGIGALDEGVENAIKRSIGNEASQRALLFLIDALGEGVEEFTSEFGDYFLNKWLLKNEDRSIGQVGKDALYSFLVGALTSIAMQAPAQITQMAKTPEGRKQLAQTVADQVEQQMETEPAVQPAAPAQIALGGEDVPDVNRDLVRSIESDPEQLKLNGIDTKGKTGSQVRAEIRAALEGQNAERVNANRGIVREFADGEYAEGRVSENGANILNSYYTGTQNPTDYVRGMISAYNAGVNGTSINEANVQALTDTQRQAAYLAGQAAGRQAAKQAPNIEKVRSFTEAETEAGRMSEDGAKMILDYYDGSQNADDYIEAATTAYNAGLEGKPIQSATNPALTQTQRDAAYMAGRAAARQGQTEPAQATVPEQAAAKAAPPTVDTTPQQRPAEAQKMPAQRAKNPGLVRDENAAKAKLSYTQKRALDTIGKVLGVNVRFVDSISTTNKDGTVRKSGAQGYYDNGEIVLALDGDDPFLTTAVHESVHRIRELSESDYAYLQDFVKRNMSDDKYGLASKIKELDEYSAEEIPEEIVADGFGRILGNEAAMRQFVAENSTAAQHVMDVVADILDRIKQALTGKDSRSLTENQRKVYSDLAGKLDVMMKYYQDAVDNVQESEGTGNDVIKFSLQSQKQVRSMNIDWDDNNESSIKSQIINHLDEINAIPSVTTVNYTPGKGPSVFQQLSDILKNRFGYKISRPDGVSFLFDEQAMSTMRHYIDSPEEAAAALAAPYVLKRGKIISGHKNHNNGRYPSLTFAAPATINGKTGNVGVVVQFADKDRVHALRVLTPEGKEFTLQKMDEADPRMSGVPATAGQTISNESASKGSIDEAAGKSNPQNTDRKESRSSRDSTEAVMAQRDADYASAVERGDTETAQRMVDEAANAAFSDSRVRTPDGNLMRLYHGTKADFTVFDTKGHGGTNGTAEGFGIYLTDSTEVSKAYGDRQIAGYANIKRPAYADRKTIKRAELARLIKETCVLEAQQMVDDGDYDSINDALRDTWVSNYVLTYEYPTMQSVYSELAEKIIREEDNDADIVYEIMNGQGIRDYDRAMDFYHDVLTPTTGIDGIWQVWKVKGQGADANVILAFDSSQIKSADPVTYDDNGNVIPLSERFNPEKQDIRYSTSDREILDAYIEEHGAIKTGEKPAREVTIPKRTTPKTKVSMTVRTVAEAGATPEEFVPTIENLVANHEFDYTPYSDEAAIGNATTIAEKKGWTAALADWVKDIEKGVVNKTNTALGWALYNNAVNSGDTETALTILRNIVAHQRNAAQAVQATRILKQLNPETQLYNAEKTVASLQEDLQKKYGDKAPNLEIDPDLAERFLRAKDDETRDKAMQDIYRDIGRQMPTTFMDRWNAWRYLAMLGNPRTHVRNVFGNLGFAPVVGAKDLTASAIEGIVNVISGGKLERTKGNVIGRGDLLKAAWDDYANIQDEALGESKYSERQMVNKEIQEGRKIFGNTKSKAWNRTGGKALEAVRRFNGTALDKEDVLFSKPHYALALAQYCAANGISAEQIASGEGLAKAREYAIKEAQKATYRDTNEFSQAISQLGRGAQWQTNKFTKGVSTVMEGVLPFRKTPANILARGVEYSPLGLMKSLTYDLAAVHNYNVANQAKAAGKESPSFKIDPMSPADMIDNLSAGLTGTGLLALGVYLASQGILGTKLRGRGGGDDKKKKYADLTGHQDYALELPDGTSITLDWLAPEALPVFIGANLAEIAQEKNGNMKLADILTAVGNVTEPMLEMSCLQSLNNVFEAVGYAKEGDMNALTSALASAATSYLTQALPTLLGQAERTGEGKRMTTYTDKNSFLTGDMQYTLGKISAKIPGFEYNQIPYIDAWGREELTGKFLERAGNNFFNPAFTSKVVESDMEKEIERLYDATGENVFPQRAAKFFNVDGERKDLTGDEYVKYATAKGQTSYVLAYRMTENKLYQNLDDADKVACIKDVYTYADQTAKTEVGGAITESWVTEAKKGVAIGISPETYILAKEAVKDVKGLKDENGKTISNSAGLQKMEIIYSMSGLNDEQRQYLFGCFDVGQTVIGYNKALVSEKLDGLRSGKITSVTAGTKTETKAKTETKTETKKEETPKVEEKPKKETADVSGSTAISSAVYDPETETATVKWASNGRTYTYDVTPESWEGFKNSSSKGSYVNRNWK